MRLAIISIPNSRAKEMHQSHGLTMDISYPTCKHTHREVFIIYSFKCLKVLQKSIKTLPSTTRTHNTTIGSYCCSNSFNQNKIQILSLFCLCLLINFTAFLLIFSTSKIFSCSSRSWKPYNSIPYNIHIFIVAQIRDFK